MFSTLIEKLGRHEDLTTDEAAQAMRVIMRGEAAPAQIAGLLIGLSMKGERPAELVGLLSTAASRQENENEQQLFHDRLGPFGVRMCGTAPQSSPAFFKQRVYAWDEHERHERRCREPANHHAR